MKVTAAHLEIMRTAIAPLDTEAKRERYRRREIPRGHLVQDIDKRYRWDLFWEAAVWLHDEDDPNSPTEYTMNHLDTALRRIVRPLTCTADCTTDCGHCKGVRP